MASILRRQLDAGAGTPAATRWRLDSSKIARAASSPRKCAGSITVSLAGASRARVKAVVASVEGYKKRFTLVSSAVELTGLQMVELFAARFRQEDGFRDLKQRLGWEECRAWTKAPIERTSQAQWVTLSLLRLAQFRLESAGEVDWWFRPPWNKDKDRPSVLDVERLFRRHAGEIRQLLSKWLGDEENSREDVA